MEKGKNGEGKMTPTPLDLHEPFLGEWSIADLLSTSEYSRTANSLKTVFQNYTQFYP
jgi:hypothetical protein